MPIRKTLLLCTLSAAFLIIFHGCAGEKGAPCGGEFPVLKGDYLGQSPPGEEPVLFAPCIVSTALFTRDIAMTPDGNEIYFGAILGMYDITQILVTRRIDGIWTRPEIAPFSGDPDYMDLEPAISPDGKRFMFLSTRPDTAAGKTEGGQDIWVMDRTVDGWSEPYNLGPPVNTAAPEFFPSLTVDGTLYFTRSVGRESYIFRSRMIDGIYTECEKLPAEVNSTAMQFNAFISPDESYLIVCSMGREDCLGGDDYYIVFRNEDDTWHEPVNMGDRVNTEGNREHSPYVSPDGRYFFFMSSRISEEFDPEKRPLTRDLMLEMHSRPGGGLPSIYWMDASFIEELRPR